MFRFSTVQHLQTARFNTVATVPVQTGTKTSNFNGTYPSGTGIVNHHVVLLFAIAFGPHYLQ